MNAEDKWKRIFERNPGIGPDRLTARLNVYEETVTLELFDRGMRDFRQVEAGAVMDALSSRQVNSGLLPENVLWWNKRESGEVLGLWRPPGVRELTLLEDPGRPAKRLKLPMPGLVFVCQSRRAPRVYAAKERPRHEEETLYRAPLPNIFRDGSSCGGTVNYPGMPERIPEEFLESWFQAEGDLRQRSLRHMDNVLRLWQELEGEAGYPLGDLVPHGKLIEVMNE